MGIKRTLLAALVFAIAVGALVVDQRQTERREADRLASARLLPMAPAEAASIVIRHLGSEMELKKAGDDWRVARPVEDAADPAAVDSLIEKLDGQSRFGSQPASEEELASYGLAKPPLTATISDASGAKSLDLLVGIDTPVPGQVYARLKDSTNYFTISAPLRDQLSRPLLEFRDRRVVPFDPRGATRLTLAYEGIAIEAAKTGETWSLEKPLAAAADESALDEILRSLQAARADDLITTDTHDVARFGLASPAATAILAGEGDAQPATFMVGFRRLAQQEPSYYAMRKGDSRVMLVGQELLDRIRPSVSDLRSKQIFTIAKEDAASIAVQWKGEWTTLLRDGDGVWRFQEAQPGEKADQAFANETLQKLLRLRVAEYLKVQLLPEESGLDAPTMSARITSRDGKQSEGIETGRPMAGRQLVYARKQGDAEVFTIGLDRPADFFLERVAFLDRTLFDYDPARVVGAIIGVKGKSFEIKKEGGAWTMGVVGGESFQVKSTDAERFFSAGRTLKWEERLDGAKFGALTLDALGGTVDFVDAAGKKLLTIDIQGQDKRLVYTKAADGSIYAIDKTIYAPFVSALNNLVKAK